MIDEFPHKGEDLRVVGGGRQYQLAVTEGILHRFRHVASGKIVDDYLGTAVCLQLLSQLHDRLLGVSVNRGVGNDDALLLGLIRGPGVVQTQIVSEILIENGTVKRADDLNV